MKITTAIDYTKKLFRYNLEQLHADLKAGRTRHSDFTIPFFMGDPGLGKTAVPRQAAYEMDIPYGQSIVAQQDAGILAGLSYIKRFPLTNEETGQYIRDPETNEIMYDEKLDQARPNWLPEFKAGIFNLDELAQANMAQQNIMSQFVNEQRVGDFAISQGVTIVATGNKPENKAGTTPMPAHLKDRLTPIEIEADHDDWLDYAAQRQLDHRIRAFLKENSQFLHKFDPTANASPTPRSWEKASTHIQIDVDRTTRLELLSGQVGTDAANTFEQWLRVESRLPKIEDILSDPKNAKVFDQPRDVSLNYLLLTMLADRTTAKTIDAIITYIRRIPRAELMAYWSRDAANRDPSIRKLPSYKKWMMTDGAKLRT